MKFDNSLRYSYIEKVRAQRSELVHEWQLIESRKLTLRQNYTSILTSSKYGPLMKTYLWFNLRLEMYHLEESQQERLLILRNEHERELHQMKMALDSVDL